MTNGGLKILSLGVDRSVLTSDSDLAKRLSEYCQIVESFSVVVPNNTNVKVKLSDT